MKTQTLGKEDTLLAQHAFEQGDHAIQGPLVGFPIGDADQEVLDRIQSMAAVPSAGVNST